MIRKYLRAFYPRMAFQFLIKFIGTITDLLLPWLLSYIIDDVVPLKDLKKICLFGGLMILCALAALFFNIIANRMSTFVSKSVTQRIRHDLFVKTMNLSGTQTDGFTLPSLMSRLTSDTYNVHQMIDRMQRLGIRAPILLLGGITMTLTLDYVPSLVLIAILPILATVIYIISKKGIPLYTKTQKSIDVLVRKVQETMSGIRVIKALSKNEYEKNAFDGINTAVIENDRKAGILMVVTNPVMNLLLNIGLSAVLVIGALRVNAGVTQPGKIIAFMSYFTIILSAMMLVTRMFTILSRGMASAERISEILNTEEDLVRLDGEKEKSDVHIEFRNVCFSYNKVKNNITDLSFSLKHGQTLGIIGATGSGKSTIINLLLRLYDVDSGKILIDGVDIRSFDKDEFHKKFGVVFQNDYLFADTIYENIDFGRNTGISAIRTAVKAAQAEFIESKESGYNHLLTVKGANLSGGQKQRVLIARALASSPEILILDDCSSALDYKTDSLLRRALKENYSDITTVIIAQRISAIKNAELIIFLDDGRVTGCGSHETLLTECPEYKSIYDAQMGG